MEVLLRRPFAREADVAVRSSPHSTFRSIHPPPSLFDHVSPRTATPRPDHLPMHSQHSHHSPFSDLLPPEAAATARETLERIKRDPSKHFQLPRAIRERGGNFVCFVSVSMSRASLGGTKPALIDDSVGASGLSYKPRRGEDQRWYVG